MAGNLVLSSVVGVERLVYKRRQVAFTKQRGGGVNTTTWFERKLDLFLGAYFMAL